MKKRIWFCLNCSIVGEFEHEFSNYFDVLLATNRDHVRVAQELGVDCRKFLGFGRMLAVLAGER